MNKEVINHLWLPYFYVMFHLLFCFNSLACFLIGEKLMLRLFYKGYNHFKGSYSGKHILKLSLPSFKFRKLIPKILNKTLIVYFCLMASVAAQGFQWTKIYHFALMHNWIKYFQVFLSCFFCRSEAKGSGTFSWKLSKSWKYLSPDFVQSNLLGSAMPMLRPWLPLRISYSTAAP